MGERIDIGDNHFISYVCWKPDRNIPSNAELFKDIPDVEKVGATIYHLNDKGEECRGFIYFDTPEIRKIPGISNGAMWQIISWEPLTISPSLLCRSPNCSDHGFIREGKWVKA